MFKISHPFFLPNPSTFVDHNQMAMSSLSYNSMSQIEAVEQRSSMAQQHKLPNWEEDTEQCTAPKFVTFPRNIDNLVEGQNAHFEAKIEPLADPNLHIEWFKDGRPVTIGHRFRPIHDFGYVAMDIVGLISEDSGTYTIRATNNVGSVETTATLQCKSEFYPILNLPITSIYMTSFIYLFLFRKNCIPS